MRAPLAGKLYMRPEDHQMIQNIHISVHTKDGIEIDADNSGYGLLAESTVEMAGMDSETTCQDGPSRKLSARAGQGMSKNSVMPVAARHHG